MKSPTIRTAGAYCIGLVLVWLIAREVPLNELVRSLARADIWFFLPVRIIEFGLMFLGECYLFARLFSYFQRATSTKEMVRPNAARCFLQVLNSGVSEGLFALVVSRLLESSFLNTGFSLLFLALIDIHVLLVMALAGAWLSPSLPVQVPWAWLVLPLVAIWALALLWLNGPPPTRLLRWLYHRPSLATFRHAQPSHYASLTLMRILIIAVQTIGFYFEFHAFAIPITILQMLAVLPLILVANGLPITPVGLGTSQAAIVFGLAGLAPRADLLALSLAHSGVGIGLRLALGSFIPGLVLTELRDAGRSEADLRRIRAIDPLEIS
jgi:hypothetical protein